VLRDDDGQPISGKKYRLVVDGDDDAKIGETASDGLIERPIDASATSGELRVWSDGGEVTTFPLNIGHLDPLEEISGVQGRLGHLGFVCPITGELDGHTRAALRAFQRKNGLDETGEPSSATVDKLREKHGH
jgi:N-acetylmuramoyl-L-alanine amidase